MDSVTILIGGNQIKEDSKHIATIKSQFQTLITNIKSINSRTQINICSILPRPKFTPKQEQNRKKINTYLKHKLTKQENISVFRIDKGYTKGLNVLTTLYGRDGVHHNKGGIEKLTMLIKQAIKGRDVNTCGRAAEVINKYTFL